MKRNGIETEQNGTEREGNGAKRNETKRNGAEQNKTERRRKRIGWYFKIDHFRVNRDLKKLNEYVEWDMIMSTTIRNRTELTI